MNAIELFSVFSLVNKSLEYFRRFSRVSVFVIVEMNCFKTSRLTESLKCLYVLKNWCSF